MLQATNLTKSYGETVALQGFDLTVPRGGIFGLLGPNGSGKTTFLKLVMGFIFADSGTIELSGLQTARIGYLPERPTLPPRSRIREYVMTIGRLIGLRGAGLQQAVDTRLAQLGLSQEAGAPIGTCSKGMLQRLALAIALLDEPPLVVLDEPMEGLDPAWQKTLRDLIQGLQQRGTTVLLSTHRLDDVAQLCSHVAILNRGRLKRAGVLSDVLPLQPQVVIEVDHLAPSLQASLRELHPKVHVEASRVTLEGEAIACKQQALQLLIAAGADLYYLHQQRATLEEIYLEAMRG